MQQQQQRAVVPGLLVLVARPHYQERQQRVVDGSVSVPAVAPQQREVQGERGVFSCGYPTQQQLPAAAVLLVVGSW